jgi:hypothetical protein
MSTPLTEEKPKPKTIVFAAGILAVGLVLGAFLLGSQTKMIGSGRATVQVKGLAQKSIKADCAEWSVWATAKGTTFAEALQNVRKEKVALDAFLNTQGFAAEVRKDQSTDVGPHYVEEERANRTVRVQDGYRASQTIVITTQDINLVSKAYAAGLDYVAAGANIGYASPNYLVSNLEEIKMSLISAATKNAYARAKEFIKHGDSRLGSMRSASQGAFYILSDSANSDTSDYGGTYDKTTVDKTARVVVTIEFNLK